MGLKGLTWFFIKCLIHGKPNLDIQQRLCNTENKEVQQCKESRSIRVLPHSLVSLNPCLGFTECFFSFNSGKISSTCKIWQMPALEIYYVLSLHPLEYFNEKQRLSLKIFVLASVKGLAKAVILLMICKITQETCSSLVIHLAF